MVFDYFQVKLLDTAPGRFASRNKLFLSDEKRLEKEMMREVRLLTGEKE
jgi:hypothetical protein